jgi:hypothetical protein
MTKRVLLILATTTLAVALLRPALAGPTAGEGGCRRACVVAAASKYLEALVSHDAGDVPLAAHARRTENGFETGNSGEEIRRNLEEAPYYRVITGMRDVRWFVEGDQATAYYLLDTSTFPETVHTSTVHLAERFRVEGGLITEIEAIFWVNPGLEPRPSGWEGR